MINRFRVVLLSQSYIYLYTGFSDTHMPKRFAGLDDVGMCALIGLSKTATIDNVNRIANAEFDRSTGLHPIFFVHDHFHLPFLVIVWLLQRP